MLLSAFSSGVGAATALDALFAGHFLFSGLMIVLSIACALDARAERRKLTDKPR